MKKATQIHILVGIFIASLNIFAVNDLSVREDVSHPRVGPGYIDEATLVVEPYGAYSEQSLYIKYSDHGQFPGRKVLVTHKFDLPEGAVVNDLWLWIGDSVMQALILERKHAQVIWDTITSFKRDPAFLTKTNNQYELKVYPLESGSFRKVKINYVVPNKFLNKTPYIDCSYKFLASDNNSKTPLKLLFRTSEDCWGTPKIVEDPTLAVSASVDTLGKKYSQILIPDLKKSGNLTLTYDVFFPEGATYSLGKTDSNVYFSFGMYEKDYFDVPSLNQGIKKSFIGIDLSGLYGINPEEFKSNGCGYFVSTDFHFLTYNRF